MCGGGGLCACVRASVCVCHPPNTTYKLTGQGLIKPKQAIRCVNKSHPPFLRIIRPKDRFLDLQTNTRLSTRRWLHQLPSTVYSIPRHLLYLRLSLSAVRITNMKSVMPYFNKQHTHQLDTTSTKCFFLA